MEIPGNRGFALKSDKQYGQGVEVTGLEAMVSRMQDVYMAQVGPHFEGGGRESGAFT